MDQQVSRTSVSGSKLVEGLIAPEATVNFSPAVRWVVLLAGIMVGLLIAVFWLPAIADDAIGMNVANTILGTKATSVTLTSVWFSFAFAIAVGLANTFTACNCVVFSCIAPLAGQKGQAKRGVWSLLMWMAIGVIVTTVIYGIAGAILDRQLPSLSKAVLPIGSHFPVRLLQSTIVFVLLGIVLFYWGLVALQLVKNPLKRLAETRPWTVPLFLGIITGCFSIGRPYPLFHTLFQYAAGSGNVALSATLMVIQGLCNIIVMALLFVLLLSGTGGRVERWIQVNPFRARAFIAFSVIGGGMFLIAYWGIRLPALFGIGWFPHL